MKRNRFLLALIALAVLGPLNFRLTFSQNTQKTAPILIDVDATDAPRKILHAKLTIPVSKSGPMTLLYPKWIPGEHGPTGPITDLSGIKITAGGKRIPWRRDDVEMYAFHINVPEATSALEVSLDFLLPAETEGFSASASATANLLVLSWNQVLLYPAGASSDSLSYVASLRIPRGWKFGTALPTASGEAGDRISFQKVSLTTLVDSPLITGSHFRTIKLTENTSPSFQIDMVSDSEAALQMADDQIANYRRLVQEANSLFGAHHYQHYHFLYTLSDSVAHFGLEHHESSDDRVAERTLLDEPLRRVSADLLPHEFVHSWNGKYRRPAGLATPDYEQPMKGELLWVYEGLTEYLGSILAARSGLRTAEDQRDHIASIAAYLNTFPGRTWRPLVDTTVAAQLLYNAPASWSSVRRGVDFYDEGELIWLEADTIIRQQTKGSRSLDDFCKLFHGAPSTLPQVKQYTFDDVVNTMNQVAAYDWRGFFNTRLTSVEGHAPLGGIKNSGWRLVYTSVQSDYQKSLEQANKTADFTYSLGFRVNDENVVVDAVPGTPAYEAGLGPGMKIATVNGRTYDVERLREALIEGKSSSTPLQLGVLNSDIATTISINYHGGERFPHLERDTGSADLLQQIIKPAAKK